MPMNKSTIAIGIAVLALIVGGLAFLSGSAPQTLSGTTNFQSLSVSGLTLGAGCDGYGGTCAGTALARINSGTCNVDGESVSIGAFATRAFDCGGGTFGATALTGITVGDSIFVSAPTTTPAANNSIVVSGVAASSTPGFIVLTLTNASSSAVTLGATATTSWNYWVVGR